MADSDSIERDSAPTPFLSRALIGRFLAVGLFVALGTFAVIQSISGTKEDPHDGHDHETVAGLEVEDSPAFSTTVKTNNPPAAIAKPAVFANSNKVIKPNVLVKPASAPVKRPTTGFSFGNQPKPAVVSPAQKPKPPTAVKSAALLPVSKQGFAVSQKSPAAVKPPERLAQVKTSGFAPKIGSVGFGDAAARARSTASNLGNSINSVAKSAADATNKSFSDLRGSVSGGAGALAAAAKETAQKTANAANAGINVASDLTKKTTSALSNPFAQPTKPSAAPSAQLAKPATTRNPSARLRPVQTGPSNTGSLRSFADRRTASTGGSGVKASAFADSQPEKKALPASNPFSADFGKASSRASTPPARPAVATSRAQSPTKPQTSATQLNARLASAVSTRGLNTPGDRSLEGVQSPSLTIEKVSPREIQVNQSADFEIKVRNVGRVVANDVMVVDRVPSGTEFIGASPEPTKLERSGDVQWTIGTIEPGQEKRIRFQLRPTQPGEIGSVAHVLFATRASMRTVVTKPVLDIVHSARPRVLIGDNVVFDVIVENRGDGPATDVIVQEEVPDQLEYQEGFRQLEYEIGTLMPGQKRKIQLALRADKVGEFRNVVFVSGKGGLEAKHEIDVEVIAPEIRVASEGPNRRFLQRKATHQFTIQNEGTAEANNVNLVARLPSGLRYVSSDNRGRYDSNSHAVYWKMPSLREGVAGTVELTTLPVEVGRQDIKFEANADLRLAADTTQQLAVEHLVDVYFEIDDLVDPIEVGTDTTYRMKIVNQGTKVASNVQLKVDFPRGLEPTSVDGDLRSQIQGQAVRFEPISSLPPGQQVQLSVRARGTAPGDLRVVASIRSDGREVAISKEETTRVYSDR
jgi:uncharacterized repeat protein (TIGR01451 family)